MQRLGYTKYVAQGGDWGNAVTELMAVQEPPGLLGIHTNMAATVPADIAKALSAGGPAPASLSADEKRAYDQLDDFYKNGLGYAIEMNNRPQTLYGIVDSPVGLAAWMLDHDIRSYDMIARVFDGKPEGLTKDDILDNITLYWLTNTAISSARLYWDNAHFPSGGFFDPRGIKIPVAVSAFPDEIYQAPQSWAEKAYPKLIFYNRPRQGRPLRGLGAADASDGRSAGRLQAVADRLKECMPVPRRYERCRCRDQAGLVSRIFRFANNRSLQQRMSPWARSKLAKQSIVTAGVYSLPRQ